MKRIILITVVLFSLVSANAQINYSKELQAITNKQEAYNLFFIDFWATWCIPCSYATQQVDFLQQKFPKELYAVTMSKEDPSLIGPYLEKHPTNLSVVSDYYGETFNKFKVKDLPYGVLLNAKGNVVWKGRAADLSANIIKRYVRKYTDKVSPNTIFNHIPLKEVVGNEDKPTEDFEILEVSNPDEFNVEKKTGYTIIEGRLNEILSYVKKVHLSQIKVSRMSNKYYKIKIKDHVEAFLENLIRSRLKLKTSESIKVTKALVFDVSKAHFWGANHIDWGDGNSKLLIGDEIIEADNTPFKVLAYEISKAKDLPFIIKNDSEKTKALNDWQVHFKYFGLMKSGLESDYGVKVSEETIEQEVFVFR